MKIIGFTLLLMAAGLHNAFAQSVVLDSYIGGAVTPSVIVSSANQVSEPLDLDFKPNSNELWVVNYGTWDGGAMVIVYNAGLPGQSSQYRKDTHSGHFMVYPSSIAFGEEGFWAGVSEIQSTNGGNSTFMGPALWTSDTAIFAVVFQNNWVNGLPLGSHYDMLHQSPFAMGIAHDSALAYWVNDGHNGNICLYDFVNHHGPGYENHSAGKIWRYIDVNVTRVPGIPSHMVVDKANGWLYFIDGGPKKLKRMNINSGSVTGNLTTPSTGQEPLASYKKVEGALVEELDTFSTQPCGIDYADNRLIVSDYTTGDIYLYNTSGAVTLMGVISTGLPGMMGVKIGPDGRIWCVNNTTDNVYRLDVADPASDLALMAITAPAVQNFHADFYATSFNVCDGSVTPSVTVMNKGANAITAIDLQYTLDNGAPVLNSWTGNLAPGATASVSFPGSVANNGVHLLKIQALTVNGTTDDNPMNNTIEGTFRTISSSSFPFSEGFSSTSFPPAGWNYIHYNPNNKMSRSTVGGFGLSSGCMKMDNFSGSLDISGQIDYLVSPAIDLTDATPNALLTFNVAYAKYNASSTDALEVLASTDCGLTWSSIYYKAGTALSTAPNSTSSWTPNSSQWRADSITLSAFAGQPEVLFAFSSISNFGNNFYVDDIQLSDPFTGIAPVANEDQFLVSPNPVSSDLHLVFSGKAKEKITGTIYSAEGALALSFMMPVNGEEHIVPVSSLAPGVYTIRFASSTTSWVYKFVKQ